MNGKETVTIAPLGSKYQVIASAHDWCTFETYEMAIEFVRHMGFKVVPLNSKPAIRILNPTDPRSL